MLIRIYYNINLNDFLLLCFKYYFLSYLYFLSCISTTINIYNQLKLITKFKLIKLLYLPTFLLNNLIKLTSYFNFLYLSSFCLFFNDLSILLDFINYNSNLNILSISYKCSFINIDTDKFNKIYNSKFLYKNLLLFPIFFYIYFIFLVLKIQLYL